MRNGKPGRITDNGIDLVSLFSKRVGPRVYLFRRYLLAIAVASPIGACFLKNSTQSNPSCRPVLFIAQSQQMTIARYCSCPNLL